MNTISRPEDQASSQALIQVLEDKGLIHEAQRFRETQEELELLSPNGRVNELTQHLKDRAREQWKLIIGEAQETADLVELINKRILSGERLSRDEQKQARAQVLDLMKLVPAGLIATMSALSPVPMTLAFTPVVLRKLGLLPSRWREAHVLETLREQAKHLENLGQSREASQISSIITQVEVQADVREANQSDALLLSYWNSEEHGALSEKDLNAYHFVVGTLRILKQSESNQRVWYLQNNDQILGPLRLDEISERTSRNSSYLTCHERTLKWVKLSDIIR